jgi:hypothetical protein
MITKFKIYENLAVLEKDEILINPNITYKDSYQTFLNTIFDGGSTYWLYKAIFFAALKNEELDDGTIDYIADNYPDKDELKLYRKIARMIGATPDIPPDLDEDDAYLDALHEEIRRIYYIDPVIINSEKFGI